MEGALSIWHEHRLQTPDLRIVWYDAGTGPDVLFINGGPGDDHRYMRPLAEAFVPDFHCVLYDQRGTGASQLEQQDADTLHVDRFLEDVDWLRRELRTAQLRLVGRSWGATLALMYTEKYPEHVERAALVGLGPLSPELAAVARANVLRPLSGPEREAFAALAARRRSALDMDDLNAAALAHIEQVTRYGVRSMVYSTEVATTFAQQFRETYSHNPRVNRYVQTSINFAQLWADLSRISAQVLIVYGHQDFEPIVQAYLLKELVPHVRIELLNESGHLPWLEQPDAFYRGLRAFLP